MSSGESIKKKKRRKGVNLKEFYQGSILADFDGIFFFKVQSSFQFVMKGNKRGVIIMILPRNASSVI